MSDYTKTTNFTAKDALAVGDPLKLIKGSYFDTEFDAIAVASTTKYDSGNLSSQAQAEALTLDTVLITPHTLNDVLVDNAGILADLQALADPGADKLLGWDESEDDTIGFTLGAGLSFSTTTLNLASAVAGAGMTMTSQVLNVIGGDGITANANDIALTAQAASATVPVSIASGVLGWDSSSITEMDIEAMSQSADGWLVDDAGVLKVIPYDEAGIKVAAVTGTSDTLALTDMNTFIEYTNAAAVTVTLNNSVGKKGNVVLIKQTGAGQITVAGTADAQSANGLKTRTADSVITLVCLVEGASAEWSLFGDSTT